MIQKKGLWNKHIGKTEKSHRTIYGMDMVELAEKYGTPIYVLFEEIIRENFINSPYAKSIK